MLTDYMRHEKKEEEGLVALKNDFDASIQRIEDYIEKCRERLITANRNNAESMRINRTKITKKKTNIGRKTTIWVFQATNKIHLTRENVDVAKKGKL